MKDHVKVIGILWIIYGVLFLALALLALLVFFGVATIPNVEDVEPGLLRLIGIFVSSFLGLIALPQIIGGLGLIGCREWARILMLVLSFISLPNVPFGTFLGAYTMVVLFNRETVRMFHEGSTAPAAAPQK
ncbi:MAG TPA: hypothetical protein VLJ16_14895 [Acidobacteriota bacterium]|nr:hypothetical protein [Acidobacteriota bacterium]